MEFEAFSFVRLILINASWIGGVAAGVKSAKRWNNWVGWAIGIGVTAALYAFLYPVIAMTEKRMCQIEPLMEDCN